MNPNLIPHGQVETLTPYLKLEISNSNGHFVLTYVVFYGLTAPLAPPLARRRFAAINPPNNAGMKKWLWNEKLIFYCTVFTI